MKELQTIPIKPTWEVVWNRKLLNGICKRYNLIYDSKYHYITSDYQKTFMTYKGHSYKLKYFSGCFYPYIVQYN